MDELWISVPHGAILKPEVMDEQQKRAWALTEASIHTFYQDRVMDVDDGKPKWDTYPGAPNGAEAKISWLIEPNKA